MGRSRSRSVSSSPGRFQEENCQYDPVSKGYRIHLADLPDNPNEDEIAKEFSRYGPLSEQPWVTRASPCFGFVVFKYKDDAFDACTKLDKKMVCGARIRTSFALPRNQGRAAGGPGVPRCYQCGRFGHFSRECKPKVTRAVRDDSSSSEEKSPARTPRREKIRSGDRSKSRSRDGDRRKNRNSRSLSGPRRDEGGGSRDGGQRQNRKSRSRSGSPRNGPRRDEGGRGREGGRRQNRKSRSCSGSPRNGPRRDEGVARRGDDPNRSSSRHSDVKNYSRGYRSRSRDRGVDLKVYSRNEKVRRSPSPRAVKNDMVSPPRRRRSPSPRR